MPQSTLFHYLKDIGDGSIGKETPDCSVVPTNRENHVLVSTTDFFYPLVEDPYMQGKIACCNVLSDLYAMGIDRCDNILMILGISLQMNENQREIVTREMIRGFDDVAKLANTSITGGQSVMNPWPMIGGIANVACDEKEIIRPNNANPGDKIILTKPLGNQVLVNAYQWARENNEKWKKLKGILDENSFFDSFENAIQQASRLNKIGANLMQKYNANCATDVTGFGIMGHAENLVEAQKKNLNFRIHTLPIFNTTYSIDQNFNFNLIKGYSAETSGGLFLCLPSENAEKFIEEIEQIDNSPAWIIGDVEEGNNKVIFEKDLEILEV